MTELNISHFNGLELTYIDLIEYIKTSVYIEKTHKNMHSCQSTMCTNGVSYKELCFTESKA